mgnify:CR=1 FL=1
MNTLTKQKVIKCYHCGNETLMNNVGEYQYNNMEDCDFQFSFTYKLFACPICYNVTLLETYGDETMVKPSVNGDYEWFTEDKILFPVNSLDNNIMPQEIKETFEAALKIRNIDNNACLIILRKALELILKDKGATKRNLVGKIEEIASKGILPEVLSEASKFAKIMGNLAAHERNTNVDSSDVSTVLEFITYIIEYLYVLPYKIQCYKERIETLEDKGMI